MDLVWGGRGRAVGRARPGGTLAPRPARHPLGERSRLIWAVVAKPRGFYPLPGNDGKAFTFISLPTAHCQNSLPMTFCRVCSLGYPRAAHIFGEFIAVQSIASEIRTNCGGQSEDFFLTQVEFPPLRGRTPDYITLWRGRRFTFAVRAIHEE